MCFSPEADVIGGVVACAIGVDALRHVRTARELPIASLPLLLGGHLIIETFVWWGLEGRVPVEVGTAAMWTYLIIAFVVLPPFVPLAIMAIEPNPTRRTLMARSGCSGRSLVLCSSSPCCAGRSWCTSAPTTSPTTSVCPTGCSS